MTSLARALAAIAALAAAPVAARAEGAPKLDAKAAFERLKSLAGEWRGKAGRGEPANPAVVRWETISGGTAVMETLFPGTPHEMRSVYHLDGGQLVMTHYCAMGNQPRVRLAPASTKDELVFEFAGGTNLDPKKDVHVHSGKIRFAGADELDVEWAVFKGEAQTGANRLVLARAK
ncbi:MAG TPA: hypothetical protein VFK90_15590 [Anaeromyxobacter sp.]|nr:hypothetical protein [Anaeromyxobacter sp.]